MRKLLVGMVALVSAVGGVAACGNNDKASSKTSVAQTTGVRVENVQRTADVATAGTSDPSVIAGPQSGALETAARFTLVLSEGKSGLKFRSKMLSDEAKAKIDELFTGDEVDLTNAHFEIEGYTDNLGSKEVNDQYGMAGPRP